MAPDARIVAGILRVNHGGEYGAIRIYRAQIAAARRTSPRLLSFLEETVRHEERHLAVFAALMPSRHARPCRLMGLWGLGGQVLGSVTGRLGDRAILTCTEAVERSVHRHLEQQLRWLAGRDHELAAAIREIMVEELAHLDFARRHRGPGGRFLDHAITFATEVAIWMTTRGQSMALHK